MSCEFAHYDGAYVLGALAGADRQAFEDHLAHCAQCAAAVRELAGLPGLLARVNPQLVVDTPVPEPVPPTLLPALLRRVRRLRQRRRYAVVGALAAAALTVLALAVTATTGGHAPLAQSGTANIAQQTMNPVGAGPLHAKVGFATASWGTQLSLRCSYAEQHGYAPSGSNSYSLVLRTRDGQQEQIASWLATPGKTVDLVATTHSRRQDIASVEVRGADGKPVLRLAG